MDPVSGAGVVLLQMVWSVPMVLPVMLQKFFASTGVNADNIPSKHKSAENRFFIRIRLVEKPNHQGLRLLDLLQLRIT